MSNRIIGLVVPPVDGAVPPEAKVLYPQGIDFVAYGLGIREVSPAAFDVALARLPSAIAYLLERGAEAISLMGTSISFYGGWKGHELLLKRMQKAAGIVPVTTMANAVVRSLRERRAARIVVGSAYQPELSRTLNAFLRVAGFEILGDRYLSLSDVRTIHSTDKTQLIELGSLLLEAHPDADALLISCGGLRTIEATDALQARYRRPVVSSAIAGCHDVVRLLDTASV